MLAKLTDEQCRVIGVLLEKEITTPEQYPLSLNGLTTGCNQKSNRDPVVSWSEVDVQNIIDELIKNRLMQEQHGGSRVVKYKHRFCNTEFGDLSLTPQQLAIICVLLLRGPQTPGELRTRTSRLADFADVTEVEQALQQLTDLDGDTLITKLEREPGKRESRYAQLFSELALPTAPQSEIFPDSTPQQSSELSVALARIDVLEKQVAELQHSISQLIQEDD